MIETLTNFDVRLFLFLNSFHSAFWDKIMIFSSGKLTWLPLYVVILFLLYRKYKWNIWLVLLSVILLITLSDQVSVHFFKNVFERLRPCHNPLIMNKVYMINNVCGGQYGFISSHAANTFALAMFTLIILKNKTYSIIILFWAALVAYSRIYLGRHYPGDIVVGAAVGCVLGYLVYRLMKFIFQKLEKQK